MMPFSCIYREICYALQYEKKCKSTIDVEIMYHFTSSILNACKREPKMLPYSEADQ